MGRLGVVMAVVVAVAALGGAPGWADHATDEGAIHTGVSTEEEARAYPCPPAAGGGWERTGPVVCLDKLTDVWDLSWEQPEDAWGCTYDARGWTGSCVFDLDMGDHIRVWGTRGIAWTPFTVTWLHDGQQPSPQPQPTETVATDGDDGGSTDGGVDGRTDGDGSADGGAGSPEPPPPPPPPPPPSPPPPSPPPPGEPSPPAASHGEATSGTDASEDADPTPPPEDAGGGPEGGTTGDGAADDGGQAPTPPGSDEVDAALAGEDASSPWPLVLGALALLVGAGTVAVRVRRRVG